MNPSHFAKNYFQKFKWCQINDQCTAPAWVSVAQLPAHRMRTMVVKNKHGSHVVLMGDAVHTAHFAIGSGTKLAIEDAIELTKQFEEIGCDRNQISNVLTRYQELSSG